MLVGVRRSLLLVECPARSGLLAFSPTPVASAKVTAPMVIAMDASASLLLSFLQLFTWPGMCG